MSAEMFAGGGPAPVGRDTPGGIAAPDPGAADSLELSRAAGIDGASAIADSPADTAAPAVAPASVDEVELAPLGLPHGADPPPGSDALMEITRPGPGGRREAVHPPRRHEPDGEPAPGSDPESQASSSADDQLSEPPLPAVDALPSARPPSPRTGSDPDPAPPSRPLPPGGPDQVAARVRDQLGQVLPDFGSGDAALKNLDRLLRAESVHSRHPHTLAHLHCPTLPVAVAADALVAEINPSMDSWDQSAAACVIEDELIEALGRLVYPAPAGRPDPHGPPGGAVTTGGTEGNLLALLFARDEAIRRHFDADPAHEGLPGFAAGKLAVLCSAVAHFSVARAAALLGLGEQAVHAVPVNADHAMDPEALAQTARRLHGEGQRIAMVLATAGTTDAGAVDPLGACEEVARRHGAWFHVDAAYGGPLLFSHRHATRLAGIEAADSVSLDLHKFGWQPIPAGLLLTRTREAFALAGRRVAYLSDLDDELAGYPNLLGRSLRTTRRADAVKIVATLQALGRSGLAERIERCFELTRYAAAALARDERFDLAMRPALTTILFRYLPRTGDPDQVNAALRRRLLVDGSAVIGRTRLPEVSAAGATEPSEKADLSGLADGGVGSPILAPSIDPTVPRLGSQTDLTALTALADRTGLTVRAAHAGVTARADRTEPADRTGLTDLIARTGRVARADLADRTDRPDSFEPIDPVGLGRPGALRLKLTLLNPDTTEADLDRLIELIAAAGAAEEAAQAPAPASTSTSASNPASPSSPASTAGPAHPTVPADSPTPSSAPRRDRQGNP